MRISIILLLVGILQTIIGHFCGIHSGLSHMQYGTHWWLYITESLFYSGAWGLFYLWVVSHEEKSNAEYRAMLRRREERIKNENNN